MDHVARSFTLNNHHNLTLHSCFYNRFDSHFRLQIKTAFPLEISYIPVSYKTSTSPSFVLWSSCLVVFSLQECGAQYHAEITSCRGRLVRYIDKFERICFFFVVRIKLYMYSWTFLETSSPIISTADQSLQILQSGSFTVDVGSSVTTVARNALSIRCNATGVPTPQIYWSKDGRSLDTRGTLHIISSLVLSDSGRYQCTASNIDGADNQDIRINVLGK